MAERKRRPRPEPVTPRPLPEPITPKMVADHALDVAILAAILTGTTITAAARVVGCDRKTIERRLLDPEFRRLIEEERIDTLRSVRDRVNAEAMTSLEVLARIRDNPRANWSSRVRCSVEILKLAVGATQIEVNQTTVVGGHSGPAPAERLEAFLTKLQNRGTELVEALPPAPIDVASTEAEAPET